MIGRIWDTEQALPDPPVIDSSVRRFFTQGQCHALALAIHERTGWDVAILSYDENDPVAAGDHVVCIDPRNRGVDIDGFQDLLELESNWDMDIVKVDPEILEIELDGFNGWDEMDMETARAWVDTVLALDEELIAA